MRPAVHSSTTTTLGGMYIYLVNGGPCDFYEPSQHLRNVLYHNNRDRTFTDITKKAGVGGDAYGMWRRRGRLRWRATGLTAELPLRISPFVHNLLQGLPGVLDVLAQQLAGCVDVALPAQFQDLVVLFVGAFDAMSQV
jgi:hypothetical protein